jgi:hypothetical protein
MNRYVALVFFVFLLAGCAWTPAPTPDLVSTQVAVEQAAAATLTAQAPTSTTTPTATATPTSTPTPTPSPSPTPTPTPTKTPTPTPTLPPNEQLDAASQARAEGNYVESILSYSDLLGGEPTEGQAREAHYQLARSYLLDGEFAAAALAAEEFITRFPGDSRIPLAKLMAARAYQAVGQCDQAIPHYQAFQSTESVLDDRVYEWIGDCHLADARREDAIGAFRQAMSSTDAV